MIKDLEWLKENIGELPCVDTVFNSDGSSYIDSAIPVMAVYDLLDQLDEPVVLSDKWIDDNSVYASSDGITEEYVHVDDLQNLLVPKQEELEVKIQELIEAYKQEDGQYSNPENAWIDEFIEDLENLLEEEQKYYIRDQHGVYLLAKNHREQGNVQTVAEIVEFYGVEEVELDYELTEQEIKDYDERYFAFAKPIEELEK